MFLVVTLALVLAAPPMEEPVCPGGTKLSVENVGMMRTMRCLKRDGQIHGTLYRYDTNTGKLIEKYEYHNNQYHGPWTRYFANGKVNETGEYQAGQRKGWWVTFHENGKQASAGEYGGGARRGVWTWWDDAGKKIEEGEYRNDVKHGIWTTWDPKTGKVLREEDYANGKVRLKPE